MQPIRVVRLASSVMSAVMVLLAFAGDAHAGLILISADRRVRAGAGVNLFALEDDVEEHASSAIGSFSSVATASDSGTNPGCQIFCTTSTAGAGASQDTTLTVLPDSLDVSGNLTASFFTNRGFSPFLGPPATASAVSSVDLTFGADTPFEYAFTSTGSIYFSMMNLDTSAFILGGSLPLAGTTGPGNYEFKVRVDGTFFSSRNSDFSFTVLTTPGPDPAPVPEPATYAMLLAGFAALARRRRTHFA